MSERDQEGFLGRWARLKRQARTGEAEAAADEGVREEAAADKGEEREVAILDAPAGEAPERPRPLTREDFSDVDFDALDFNSDYRRFMAAGVPDDVRNQALRKLWASDPVLTMHDGLDDYCGDYTDAATVPAGVVKTAYRVGKGFLSDAEVAEWEKLGKPPAEADTRQVASAEQAPSVSAESECTSPTDALPSSSEATAPLSSQADGDQTSAEGGSPAESAAIVPEATEAKAT
jgi:hypothetical protein